MLAAWFAIMLTAALAASPALHAQTYQVIHNFSDSVDGQYPNGLTRDAAGNFYGTAWAGGPTGRGTVFKLDATTHMLSVLHAFRDAPDASRPLSGVIVDSAGNLYGTTESGGINNAGAVYKIDTARVETILHSFNGVDGGQVTAGLARDPAGNFYAPTYSGGLYGEGVVFWINTLGTEKTLYQFVGPDGSRPYGRVARDSSGNLYGTTASGGAYGEGNAFKLSPNGTLTVLHNFTGGADGTGSSADSLLDAAGNLYSTSAGGGDFGFGTVFKIDSTGNLTVLHSFSGPDGANPAAGLVFDAAGNLYGNTVNGGDFNLGVVFKIDPLGNETVLHSFAGNPDGQRPTATMLVARDGTIFGSTGQGGTHDAGTLFRLKP
jgi:uncharacterized repeat protein (TIGR03803 family)